MRKILLTEPFPDFVISGLRKFGKVVHILKPSAESLSKEIPEAEILIIRSKTRLDKKLIGKGKKLRLVITATHGFEHVDTEELEKMGIEFHTIPMATTGMREFVFGMMISLLRKIPQADRSVREGKWLRHDFPGGEIFGKTLGIVGLGPIGKDVARIAKHMGMEITACDPNNLITGSELTGMGIKLEPLSRVIRSADVLTIHAHLNEKTMHIIGKRELEGMKKGSYLINTARGGLVDQEALFRAIKSGHLAGAALDVYEEEPPGEDPITKLDNVVLTPHIGGITKESTERVGRKVLEIVKGYA